MTRRTYRLWHHWLSVIGGVFLLIYSVTGLWHIPHQYIPWRSPPPAPVAPAPISADEVQVTTGEVLALADAQTAGASNEIRSLSLVRIGTRPVYDLRSGQGRFLIDAGTGSPFQVTPAVAEEIVRERFDLDGVALDMERLEEREFAYRSGPLPVYLFRPSDEPTRIYSVTEIDGSVGASTRAGRVNRYLTQLHALRPARDLTGSLRVQHLTMLWTTVLCVLLALTGFFLILPLPKMRRAKRVGEVDGGGTA